MFTLGLELPPFAIGILVGAGFGIYMTFARFNKATR